MDLIIGIVIGSLVTAYIANARFRTSANKMFKQIDKYLREHIGKESK